MEPCVCTAKYILSAECWGAGPLFEEAVHVFPGVGAENHLWTTFAGMVQWGILIWECLKV